MKRSLLTLTLLTLSSAALAATHSYTVLAPATPGGGYDTLARNLASGLDIAGLTTKNTVVNVPGDGGVKGLQGFVKTAGASDLVVFGLTTLAAMNTVPNAGVNLADLRPVARLATDSEVILVPESSSYRTPQDILSAVKREPLRFGGASPASADHLFTAMFLRSGGAPLSNMKWIPSSGNLQAIKAMLAGEVDVVSVSVGVAEDELKKGGLRPIVVSAPARVRGVAAPSCEELKLDCTLVNWRGVFASASLNASEFRQVQRDLLLLSHNPVWLAKVRTERQQDAFQTGDTFERFLLFETGRVAKLIDELGLRPK